MSTNPTPTPRTDYVINAPRDASGVYSELESMTSLARNLERELATANRNIDEYRDTVSQAQDALGEYWVTFATLPAACRSLYQTHAADRRGIREHLERADVVCSDDPVEAVGQLVDELLRRAEAIRRITEAADQAEANGKGDTEEREAKS